VTNWINMSFILVPQADRRQRSDRRRFYRGGRRATDQPAREQLSGEDATGVWTVTGNEARATTEKQYFN